MNMVETIAEPWNISLQYTFVAREPSSQPNDISHLSLRFKLDVPS